MAEGQQYPSIPPPQTDAEAIPMATVMLPSGKRPFLRRHSIAFGMALTLLPIIGIALRYPSEDSPASTMNYSQATPDNVISRLQKQIDSKQVTLEFDSKKGYLPAVLKVLHIPITSQILVFSKTSIQKELISPQTPRALYFNDSAYIGYVPEANSLEVAATDPKLGSVYYILLQKPKERPLFFRKVEACLECHAQRTKQNVPKYLMHSVSTDAEGALYPLTKSYVTTDKSPLNERWGGWYVSGMHGAQGHMGNTITNEHGDHVPIVAGKGANITSLNGLFDTSAYLTPYSDIVALMVFAHQTNLQSLIAQANYLTRAAPHTISGSKRTVRQPQSTMTNRTPERIKVACEPLLKALLFTGEAPLKAPVVGTSSFGETFAAQGPKDRKNRSLREFDLKHRLFRYPCSYTIYSDAFDALPEPAKDYLFRRLEEVLRGRDQSKEFASLTPSDRRAIREILMETKPTFRAWLAKSRTSSR